MAHVQMDVGLATWDMNVQQVNCNAIDFTNFGYKLCIQIIEAYLFDQ